MSNIILLTGKPRAGKTTALKTIINMIGKNRCGGFYTEEVREDGNRIGFDCVSLNGEVSRISDINFESDKKVGRYSVNVENFEKISLDAIDFAIKNKEVVIVDEIGPMQLLSAKFKKELEKLFKAKKIVVGTIFFDSYPIVDDIKKNLEVRLITITNDNRDDIPQQVLSIIEI